MGPLGLGTAILCVKGISSILNIESKKFSKLLNGEFIHQVLSEKIIEKYEALLKERDKVIQLLEEKLK